MRTLAVSLGTLTATIIICILAGATSVTESLAYLGLIASPLNTVKHVACVLLLNSMLFVGEIYLSFQHVYQEYRDEVNSHKKKLVHLL